MPTRLRQLFRTGSGIGAGLVAIGLAAPASADEPRTVTEPRVMQEPAEITTVVDAFDDQDPFDLNITLGFQQVWKSANIRRESFIDQAELASGGFTSQNLNIAEYSESTSRLNARIDIGLFQDIALYARLPVILANDRELKGLEGSDAVQSAVLVGAPGEQLFRLPFKSPTRSGIEYLAVGLDFGIMNQFRNPSKPTWVFGFEGRFSLSEPMHACTESSEGLNQPGPQRKCAFPGDVNRNGIGNETGNATSPDANPVPVIEGNDSGDREAGVSRGTTAFEVHTYLSKRIKYIEPYGGFHALFEFQNDDSDYGSTDLKGSLVNHPPLRGGFVLGLQVIPWEVRDQFQRFSVDFRFNGEYVSEGRDYSELFDALGSSDARSLRYPNFAEFQAAPAGSGGGSVVNPRSQKVYTTGLTDVQQHGRYRFSSGLIFQAGEYIKFGAGGGYTLVQGHFITFDQPCNPDFDSTDNSKSGPCRSSSTTGTTGNTRVTGIPNPNYRPTMNIPGRRFRVTDTTEVDLFINATVMF